MSSQDAKRGAGAGSPAGLRAGRYTIWRDERTPAATVTVTGGQASSCHWPG